MVCLQLSFRQTRHNSISEKRNGIMIKQKNMSVRLSS